MQVVGPQLSLLADRLQPLGPRIGVLAHLERDLAAVRQPGARQEEVLDRRIGHLPLPGVHGRELAPGEVPRQVEQVHARQQHRPAHGLRRVALPRQRGGGQALRQAHQVDAPQQRPQLAGLADDGVPAQRLTQEQRCRGARVQAGQPPGLGQRPGHGLLQQQRLAGRQDRGGQLEMGRRRRADDDPVNVGRRDDVGRLRQVTDAVPRRQFRAGAGVAPADRRHGHPGHVAQPVAQVALAMGAGPDDPDPELHARGPLLAGCPASPSRRTASRGWSLT